MRFISRYALCIVLFCLFNTGIAQTLIDDTQILNVLIFKNESKDKIKMISESGKVRYKLRTDNQRYVGKLEKVNESTMIVNGREVRFEDCIYISGRVYSEETIAGGVGAGVGLTTIVLGASLLGNVIVGGTVIAGGATTMGLGLFFLTKPKRFHLDKGWEVYAGKIEYDPTK